MITVYESATRLTVTGATKQISALREHFRFHPNGYFHSDRYAIWELTGGTDGWDGYRYSFQKLGPTSGTILRGRLEELLAFCHGREWEMDLRKLLPKPLKELTVHDIPPDIIAGDFELDDRQRLTIQQWLVHGYGVGHLAVNSGKTACFAGAALMIKQHYPNNRILYITVSERLANQAFKDFSKMLPGRHITQFGGGKKDNSGTDVVICTVAMLHRHYRKLHGSGFFKKFIAVLYDEVQHCGSVSSERVLTTIPAYFRLGASDSQKEDDPERHAAILGHFGPVRNVVTQAPLIAEGRSAQPIIYLVDLPEWQQRYRNLPFRVSPHTPAWALVEGEWRKGTYLGPAVKLDPHGAPLFKKHRTVEDLKIVTVEREVIEGGFHRIQLEGEDGESKIESRWCLLERVVDKAIIRFKERNDLIVRWTAHYSNKGWPTIVVATRTLHIHILQALISAVVNPDLAQVLYGTATTSQRDEAFAWFRETPGAILITPLVKEGVSISEIRAGVIADYVSDAEFANQIIGRFIRKKEVGNEAHITFFMDRQHPSLRRGCAEVFQRLQKIDGYQFVHPVRGPETIPTEVVLIKE